MNTKKLLLTLFVLYWVIVYGASFFMPKSMKPRFDALFPTGYQMYAPATTTNYDVIYEFFRNGKMVRKISLADQLETEKQKSILKDKEYFIKRRLYLESLKLLDFNYQQALFNELKFNQTNDFSERIEKQAYLKGIVENLDKYVNLYSFEHPDFEFDSVRISAVREPIVLAFDIEYKGDFTYRAGQGVFYSSTFIK